MLNDDNSKCAIVQMPNIWVLLLLNSRPSYRNLEGLRVRTRVSLLTGGNGETIRSHKVTRGRVQQT